MSVISNRHVFTPFVSGTSKPFTFETGEVQRLAKVGYKAKSKKTSVCISIPMLSDGDVNKIALAFPVDQRKRVEDFQDGLIRSLYEFGKSELSTAELGADQVSAFIEAMSNSDRLTGETVSTWWNEFQETAIPVLSAKYKTEDESVLAKKSKLWGDAFLSLTGRNPVTRERITQLLDMLEYSEDDDAIASRLAVKLQLMVREVEEQEAL